MRKTLLLLLSLSLGFLGSGSNNLFARPGYYKADPVLSNIGSKVGASLFSANTVFAKFNAGKLVTVSNELALSSKPEILGCPTPENIVTPERIFNTATTPGATPCSAAINVPQVAATDDSTAQADLARAWFIFALNDLVNPVQTSGGFQFGPASNIEGFDLPLGEYKIKYLVRDDQMQVSDTCFFNIKVIDGLAPVLSLGVSDTTLNTVDANLCGRAYTPGTPIVTDCGGINFSYIFSTPNTTSTDTVTGTPNNLTFPIGTSTIVYIIKDNAGNFVTDEFTVTVVDTIKPQARVFSDLVNNDDSVTYRLSAFPGLCTASFQVKVFAKDACGIDAVTENGATVELDRIQGDTAYFNGTLSLLNNDTLTETVTFTISDNNGNDSIVSADITLVNDIAPIFLAQQPNQTETTDPGVCTFTQVYPLSGFGASHPCGIDSIAFYLDGVYNQSFTSFSGDVTIVYPLGTTNVQVRAYKHGFAPALDDFFVEITDITKPKLVTTADTITVFINPNLCNGANINDLALFIPNSPDFMSDNCTSTNDLFATITNNRTGIPNDARGFYPLGITNVIFTVTDGSGNVRELTVRVEVLDNTIPDNDGVVTNLAFDAIAACTVNQTISIPASADACGIDTITYQINGGNPLGVVLSPAPINPTLSFPVGITTILWTIVDNNGNTATQTYIVTVTDVAAPVLSNQIDTTFEVSADSCSVQRSFTFTATDNCTVDSLFYSIKNPSNVASAFVGVSGSSISFSNQYLLGTSEVTVVALDVNGLTDTLRFDVTVEDNILPTFNTSNQVVSANANCDYQVTLVNASNVLFGNQIADNCTVQSITASVAGATTLASFDAKMSTTLNLGVNTVTIVATDNSGNSTTKSFTITVEDNSAPIIPAVANIIDSTFINECSKVINYLSLIPTATDNCDNVAITGTFISGIPSGTQFPLGTTTIKYRYVDAAGNADTLTFTITLLDRQAPVIRSVPGDVIVNLPSNSCSVPFIYNIDVQDNCDAQGLTIVATYPSGTVFSQVGEYTNNITITDVSGNTVTASFKITVRDNIAPNFVNFPTDIVTCNSTITYVSPTATDNCTLNPIQVSGPASGSNLAPGNYTVTFSVSDINGNNATRTLNITVLAPVTVADAGTFAAVCQGGQLANLNANAPKAGETGKWSTPFGEVIFTDANNPTTAITVSSPGSYRLTWTITGNSLCGSTTDDVIVTVDRLPSVSKINGFPIDTVEVSSIVLSAEPVFNGTGTWSTSSTAIIVSQNNSTTDVTNLTLGANEFTWTVASNNTCPNSVSSKTVVYVEKPVVVEEVDIRKNIPAAFTPDNDNTNDTWTIPGINDAKYTNGSIEVFNRWGAQVFKSSIPEFATKGWNGTNDGEELAVASYYYVIDLGDGSPLIKGFVSIIR